MVTAFNRSPLAWESREDHAGLAQDIYIGCNPSYENPGLMLPLLATVEGLPANSVTDGTRRDRRGQEQDRLRDTQRDFLSPEFDPLLALQTPGLQPPVPDAPVLDNVSKCTALLPPDETQPQAARTDVLSEEERIKQSQEQQAKKAKAAALKQRAQKTAQRAEASVRTQSLANIMLIAAKGPLTVLAKWQASAQQVYVITRHAAGVRGRAVGVIRAFDRFMNLVLADVEEAYTVIIKVPRVKQQQLQQQQQQPKVEAAGSPSHALVGDQHATTQQQQQQQQQQIVEIMGLLPPPQEDQQHQEQETVCKDQQQEQEQQYQAGNLQQQQQPLQQQSSHTRTRVRWCRKQEHRYRKLDQVLLKGDSIVLISSQPPLGGVLQPPDSNIAEVGAWRSLDVL